MNRITQFFTSNAKPPLPSAADEARQLADAAGIGDLATVDRLLRRGQSPDCMARDRRTALEIAATGGHLEVVKRLLEAGASPNLPTFGNYLGRPIHLATIKGHKRIISALIKAGADVNGRDHTGDTPLHIAAARGNAKTLRHLLRAGATVDARNNFGQTPLMCVTGGDIPEKVADLTRAGADIDATDLRGFSVLAIALDRARMVRIPQELIAFTQGDAAALALHLVEAGARLDNGVLSAPKALQLATLAGRTRLVEAILQRGVDINAANAGGETALHMAAHLCHQRIAVLLLNHGASVDRLDRHGRTPCARARQSGALELAKLLKPENVWSDAAPPWEILGLDAPPRTSAELKHAYRAAMLKCHPDKTANDAGHNVMAQRINLAREVLEARMGESPN